MVERGFYIPKPKKGADGYYRRYFRIDGIEYSVRAKDFRVLAEKEKQKKENPEGVRLMTIHAAKALEFHTVFIVEANEGRLPYKKARTDAQTEEERRLFYVAMTRAKEKLTVCYVRTKSGKEISPSRFVDELLDVV